MTRPPVDARRAAGGVRRWAGRALRRLPRGLPRPRCRGGADSSLICRRGAARPLGRSCGPLRPERVSRVGGIANLVTLWLGGRAHAAPVPVIGSTSAGLRDEGEPEGAALRVAADSPALA